MSAPPKSEAPSANSPPASGTKGAGTSGTGPDEDQIQGLMGSLGKYHILLSLFLYMSKISVVWGQLNIIFLAPKVHFKCLDNNVTDACPCNNPKYDTSVFTQTIVMEWNLICGRAWLASLVQTVLQAGTLVGSLLFGMSSDRYGRRWPLCVAIVMNITSSVLAAIVPDYWVFVVLRFFMGASIGGLMVITFVIAMEFIGAKYRQLMSAVFHLPFNLGHMALPWISYFTRDHVHFQLATSVWSVVLLSYLCFMPETPRWLLAMKRKEEAIKILERVAKVNKLPTEHIRATVDAQQAATAKNEVKKGTIVDLFRTPNIRKNNLIMSFNWFACSYYFYGVSQLVGQLTGDIFVNVSVGAAFTMLGTLSCIPLSRYFGRRSLVSSFNMMCAICLAVVGLLPEGTVSVMLACAGQVFSFIVFTLVYLYCAELFPTVVRNNAVGFSSMSARFGSMIAPFVLLIDGKIRPFCFAIVPFVASILTVFLPETKGIPLMTTIEEGEQLGKKQS